MDLGGGREVNIGTSGWRAASGGWLSAGGRQKEQQSWTGWRTIAMGLSGPRFCSDRHPKSRWSVRAGCGDSYIPDLAPAVRRFGGVEFVDRTCRWPPGLLESGSRPGSRDWPDARGLRPRSIGELLVHACSGPVLFAPNHTLEVPLKVPCTGPVHRSTRPRRVAQQLLGGELLSDAAGGSRSATHRASLSST